MLLAADFRCDSLPHYVARKSKRHEVGSRDIGQIYFRKDLKGTYRICYSRWLAAISVLTVISVSALTWVCVLLDDKPTIRQIPQPTWEAVAIAYGIIAFQFDIHPTILSVQMDMEHKSKLGFPIIAGFLSKEND